MSSRVSQAQRWITAYYLLWKMDLPSEDLQRIEKEMRDQLFQLGWLYIDAVAGFVRLSHVERLRKLRSL